MAKPTLPTSYLTSDGSRIYPAPFFLYEVTTYKLFNEKQAKPSKGRAELINSKFFKSSKPLKLEYKIIRNKDYSLEMSMTWIGAPMSYIRDNNLTIYDPKKKSKNEKGNRNVSKRSHR